MAKQKGQQYSDGKEKRDIENNELDLETRFLALDNRNGLKLKLEQSKSGQKSFLIMKVMIIFHFHL